MAAQKQWLSTLLTEIKKSPLSSNLAFGLVLFCFEKIVEVEFACPCSAKLNPLFASLFFVVPAVIVFILMLMIKGCCKMSAKYICDSFVPSITWLIIVFLDGRYYVCAMTDWSGRYKIIEGAEPQRWCKPANMSEEYADLSQGWYARSQGIGFGIALGFTIFFALIWCFCKEGSTTKETTDTTEMQSLSRS